MSQVTGVTLIMGLSEESPEDDEDGAPILVATINNWLSARPDNEYWQLGMVDQHYLGTKHPQIQVAGGGFNHFPDDEFAYYVMALPWVSPQEVVLIIHTEEGETFVFRPAERQ